MKKSPLLAIALAGCGEQYCQSGPKYGTQCYTINEVEWQETQVRGGPPEEASTQPSPGCALLTPKGVVQQPLPSAAASAAPSRVPPPYLMSGACTTRRRTAHGAVR